MANIDTALKLGFPLTYFDEYASSNEAWDATGTTTKTSSQGSTITGALTATRTKLLTFPTANQDGDEFIIEYRVTGTTIFIASDLSVWAPVVLATVNFSAFVNAIGASTVTIAFSRYAQQGTTYNTLTGAVDYNAATYDAWRLRRRRIVSSSGGGGSTIVEEVAVSKTAVSGTRYEYDMTSGPYTLTLPGGTTAAQVSFQDRKGTATDTKRLLLDPGAINSIDTNANGDIVAMNYANFSGTLFRASGSSIWYRTKQLTSTIQPGFQTGYTAGNAISAGNIGETLIQSRLFSAPQSLSNGATANVTATPLTLTPGVWELQGDIAFLGASATTSFVFGCLSLTSATAPATDTIGVPNSNGERRSYATLTLNNLTHDVVILPSRVQITVNTTYYLVAAANFSAGTVSCCGSIRAVRIV